MVNKASKIMREIVVMPQSPIVGDLAPRKRRLRKAASAPIALRPTMPDRGRLFDLGQLDCRLDLDHHTLWTFMTPAERPNYNEAMLRDFETWQSEIARTLGSAETGLRYLVLGSRFPRVFNYGGDLELFTRYILAGDRAGLERYGKACVRILHRNMLGLGLPVISIALVQGEALGGGFESILSFDVVIAERTARFGLPEAMFGLFPGMGAHSFLSRRIGSAKAEEMIRSGRVYSAEELHALGLVHELVEPGEGVAATEDYIRRNHRYHAGQLGARRAARLVENISLRELEDIVEIWADSALGLTANQLKMMARLAGAQTKLSLAS
jgi:DSF synthase